MATSTASALVTSAETERQAPSGGAHARAQLLDQHRNEHRGEHAASTSS